LKEAVEEMQKMAAVQIAQAEGRALARYEEAVAEVQRQAAAQIARAEDAAQERFKLAFDDMQKTNTSQIAQAEEEACAKYDAVVRKIETEAAARIKEVEEAAQAKYGVALEKVEKEAAAHQEAALRATQRAEAAIANAAETSKQMTEANARAEVAERSTVNATRRAQRAEENIEKIKERLGVTQVLTTITNDEVPLPDLHLLIQEEEDQDDVQRIEKASAKGPIMPSQHVEQAAQTMQESVNQGGFVNLDASELTKQKPRPRPRLSSNTNPGNDTMHMGEHQAVTAEQDQVMRIFFECLLTFKNSYQPSDYYEMDDIYCSGYTQKAQEGSLQPQTGAPGMSGKNTKRNKTSDKGKQRAVR
jgi:hypothetical protein